MMRLRISNAAQATVVGLGLMALGLGGCDGGAKEDKAKTAAKGKDKAGAAKAGDAAGKGGDAPAKVGEAPAKAEGGAIEAADDGGEAEPDAPGEGDLVATLDKRVQRAAKLAKEIESRPTEADDILDAADLDREGFEDLIYTIGADPALSKQYQLALASD